MKRARTSLVSTLLIIFIDNIILYHFVLDNISHSFYPGIDRLLKQGVYSAAYPLHEVKACFLLKSQQTYVVVVCNNSIFRDHTKVTGLFWLVDHLITDMYVNMKFYLHCPCTLPCIQIMAGNGTLFFQALV